MNISFLFVELSQNIIFSKLSTFMSKCCVTKLHSQIPFFLFAYKTVMKNLRLKNRFAFSDSVFLRRIWFSQVVRFDYRDVILHFAAKKCFQRGVARVRTYRKVRREGEKSQFIDLIIRFYKKKMIVISTLVNLFGRYLKFKTNRIRKHCY